MSCAHTRRALSCTHPIDDDTMDAPNEHTRVKIILTRNIYMHGRYTNDAADDNLDQTNSYYDGERGVFTVRVTGEYR